MNTTKQGPGDMNQSIDIKVEEHGSIVLFRPLSQAGTVWLDAELEAAPRMGRACAAQPRYVQDIINGMEADGLAVSLSYCFHA